MEWQWVIRNGLVFLGLIFLGVLVLKKKQDQRLNWALFYSTLWVSLSLLVVNYLCIRWGFWDFAKGEELSLFIPYDLFFVWVLFWGIILPLILRGRHLLIIILVLLWIDIIAMPQLEEYRILKLNNNWLVGEIILILMVYLPAHLWFKYSLNKINVGVRSLFQLLCTAIIFVIGVPFVLFKYIPQPLSLDITYLTYLVQFGLIISLPSFIAVVDLNEKGEGTPFPYDPTKRLVRTGVYAYIRNPIQWSLTLIFIPLAIYYQSIYLLIGIVVAVLYTIGVANQEETDALRERFGESWINYKKSVPAWYFQWKPSNIPQGELYFKQDCKVCSEVSDWFKKRNSLNLIIRQSNEYYGSRILQVTYKSEDGHEYKSIRAIASGLEHINLAWAALAWFVRLPLISQLLQLIIDSMGLKDSPEQCKVD